jgi:hypothetical protein
MGEKTILEIEVVHSPVAVTAIALDPGRLESRAIGMIVDQLERRGPSGYGRYG